MARVGVVEHFVVRAALDEMDCFADRHPRPHWDLLGDAWLTEAR